MIKHGVDLRGIKPEMVMARVIAGEIYARYGYPAIITSGLDDDGGRTPDSKHPNGYALDFRTRHLDRRLRPVIAEKLKEALGAQYDVVLENDHIHVEFDDK